MSGAIPSGTSLGGDLDLLSRRLTSGLEEDLALLRLTFLYFLSRDLDLLGDRLLLRYDPREWERDLDLLKEELLRLELDRERELE